MWETALVVLFLQVQLDGVTYADSTHFELDFESKLAP